MDKPDLFGLNSTVGSITGSTSFWVQQMFSTHRGTTILSVSSDANFGPVFWVASSAPGGKFYMKLANYGSSTQSLVVKFPGQSFSSQAILTTLSGGKLTSNYPGIVSITPTTKTVGGSARDGYSFSIPPWGVAVLAIS